MNERTVVVGAGVTGLAAATMCARRGGEVVVVERAHVAGGRAASQTAAGFTFNQGAHALYAAGPAVAILRELDVRWTGGMPSTASAVAVCGGVRHRLPTGLASLASTSLLHARAKIETAKWLARLPTFDAAKLDGVALDEWLGASLRHEATRALVRMLARVATFDATPSRASAGAVVRQLRLATKGVYYLDGGWQTLVDGLRASAERAGVVVRTGARAVAIEHDASVRAVRLDDGTRLDADAVIVATPPRTLAKLLDERVPEPKRWADTLRPVRVACLDVALDALPDARATVAFGVDAPTYLSVHSASAKLAPAGGALVQTVKYLADGPADGAEAELEAWLDAMQPGWRDRVASRRTLPHMIVTHAAADAALGGTRGRPGPLVGEVRRLYVAGDWVGPDGMLLDACLSSAKVAASLAVPEARRAAAG